MGLLHIAEMPEYVALLHRDAAEVRQLLKDLLINVTSFFRDAEAFDEVREKALAPLIQARSGSEPVRVPACATGEEAYPLDMPEGMATLATITDITERKRREE
jgi:two-component system CheB/CheR fusion protein